MSRRTRIQQRKGRHVSLAPMPFNGDHGTGTTAALAGTTLEPLLNDKGSNPNNMARRYRKDVYKALSLTMKQSQAANAIRDAYCRVEALSSGGELKEQVDSTPKPDATIDVQCGTISHLLYLTKWSTRTDMRIFDHVLRQNEPIAKLDRKKAPILVEQFKEALDRVAAHLRY